MRKIDLIVVHCSATHPSMDIGVKEIRKWHVEENNWSDIGYHYVIRRNGIIETGRPEEKQGAHVYGFNKTSLGICLVGGTNANDKEKADFNFTKEQLFWLDQLLISLGRRYPKAQLCGHRDLDSKKACPVFNVVAWWGKDSLGDETGSD